MTIKEFVKKVLLSKYFQPAISFLTLLETAIIAICGWSFSSNSESEIDIKGIVICLAAIIITIWLPVLLMISYKRNHDTNRIISCLCEIQNNYLINPEFKTAQQHTDASMEKKLSHGGTAKILTNSLTYDMSSASDIADNISRGAQYIYILPRTNIVIRSLENYIEKISNELSTILKDTRKNMDFLEKNITFWFFEENITCLYNFATLRQTAVGGTDSFDQAWWYINPDDNSPASYMLAKEIDEGPERNSLDSVFSILEKNTKKHNGKEIFDHLANLEEFIRS